MRGGRRSRARATAREPDTVKSSRIGSRSEARQIRPRHYDVAVLVSEKGQTMAKPKGRKSNEKFTEGKAREVVEYQDDAIVSREIVKRKTGTVTAFAFDKGQGLSEHTAPFDALVHILDGRAEISIGGKSRKLAAGGMILMPANVPHALKAVARFKMLLVMIR
jgi:quercetin dioxygenase-like cupin family protein